MKYILSLIAGLFLYTSCTPDEEIIVSHAVGKEDIKILELRADHKTLIPNGIAKMEFRVVAYGIKDFVKYTDDKVVDTLTYKEELVRDTFEIPSDLIPEGYIKVYDESGKELADKIFSTTQTGVRTLSFYAQAGEVKSKNLSITIREVPAEAYEEIVIPVIFHIVVPPASSGPTYSVTTADLQSKLDRVNDIFNRRVTPDPNGGNAKIVFKLAEYSNKGALLIEKGKNMVTLSTALGTLTEYTDYIKANLIWDPTKYMNVWVAKFSSSGANEFGTTSYKSKGPTVRLKGTNPVKGLTTKEVESFTLADAKTADYLESGFMINFRDIFNPNSFSSSNTLEVASVFALYFGILVPEISVSGGKIVNMVDGDTDYCPDTYYYSTGQGLIYKSNDLGKYSVGDPLEYFTSFNVMDRYSRKNSISADQATRIREVIEKCPSRWAYKSTWAFTGK